MLYSERFEYEQASLFQPLDYPGSEIALKIVEIHYAVKAVLRDVEIIEIDDSRLNRSSALAGKLQALSKSAFGDVERDDFQSLSGKKDRVAACARRKVESKPSRRERVAVFAQEGGRLARKPRRAKVSRFPSGFVGHCYRLQQAGLLLIASSRVL
jgi:hypothetical protein